jgi:hypothetical protein
MDIFISWSGPRSRAVAETLKEYLPMIVNAFNPWLSTADIDKGARWSAELSTALATAKAGIICLTPNNLTAPYILFESGAISKTVEKPYVCTLLVGMEPSDVSGPLAQFQATKPTKDDLLQLMRTLNKALGETALKDSQLEAAFELCWPKIEERLTKLPADGPTGRPSRTDRELLEELVDTVRSTSIDDGVLQAHIGQTVADISVRLSAIESRLPPFVNLEPSRLGTLSQLLGTATLGVEAKTARNEKTFYGEAEPVGSDTHKPALKLKNRMAKARDAADGISLARAEKDDKKD